MNNLQTAVEYLLISLLNKFPKEMEYLFSLNNTLIEDTFNETKEMFEQQIIDAYESGIEEGRMRESSEEYNLEYYENAERYYNETFNN